MATLQNFFKCNSKRTGITWYPQEVDNNKEYIFICDGIKSIHYRYNEILSTFTYRGAIDKLSVLFEVIDGRMNPTHWGSNAEMYNIIGGYDTIGKHQIVDITHFKDSDKSKMINEFTMKSWYEILVEYPLV